MTHVSRRLFLLGTSALVAGCSTGGTTTTTPPTVPALTTDVNLVASGFATLEAALAALPNDPVPATILAKINTEVATIQADAGTIASAISATSTSVVTGLTGAIQAVAALATPFFPAAPLVAGVVNAGMSLITTILAEAGITGAPLSGAPAPVMSVAQARLILAKGA